MNMARISKATTEQPSTEENAPMGACDWQEICTPVSFLKWQYGIGENSNY